MFSKLTTKNAAATGLIASWLCTLTVCAVCLVGSARAVDSEASSWNFVVAGDSRNCGNVVMPSIAAGVHAHNATFYWHLGDLRAIFDFDDDFRQLHPKAHISDYLTGAWVDFQRNQIEPFGDTPFFLGIGNHETMPPKSRSDFVITFADWLDAPIIHDQRLKDDPHDHAVRTYFHWLWDGIDFVSLDNSTPDQFDDDQLKWLGKVLERDRADTGLRAVVVGMHAALPNSIAAKHSMTDFPTQRESGQRVYGDLLKVHKPVYVLASHSHFVMSGIYNTKYWRDNGGVLPGWIVGTAGAIRYKLPPGAEQA